MLHFILCLLVFLDPEAVNADKMIRDTVCRALNQFEISPIWHLLVVQPPVDCVCVCVNGCSLAGLVVVCQDCPHSTNWNTDVLFSYFFV